MKELWLCWSKAAKTKLLSQTGKRGKITWCPFCHSSCRPATVLVAATVLAAHCSCHPPFLPPTVLVSHCSCRNRCSCRPLFLSPAILVTTVAQCCPLFNHPLFLPPTIAHCSCHPLSPGVLVAHCFPLFNRPCSSRQPFLSPTILVAHCSIAHCFCRPPFLSPTVAHRSHRQLFLSRLLLSPTVLPCSPLFFHDIRMLLFFRLSVTRLKTECCFFIISSYLHRLHQRCITQLIIALHLQFTSSALVFISCKTILIYPFVSDSFVLQQYD